MIAPREMLPELTPAAELALLCRTLFREGYDDHIAGHITYLVAPGVLLVNPWELAWDEIRSSDVLKIDLEGNILDGPGWTVTPGIQLHLELHRKRDDVILAVHNHSRWGTVWADTGRVPPIYDQTGAMVDGDPVVCDEYAGAVDSSATSGSLVDAMGTAKWALLANHGVFITAKDVRQAHLRAIVLEWRCRQAWHVEALGGGRPVPADVAASFGSMVDTNGFPHLWEAMARRELRADPSILD